MPCEKIIPNAIYTHDPDSVEVRYQVEDVRSNVTGWERTHRVAGEMVNYVQLDDGEECPAGTPWSREKPDFQENFTLKSKD